MALNTYLLRLQADESKHCQRISAGACRVLTKVVSLGNALRQAHGSAASLEGQLRLSTMAVEQMAKDLQASSLRGATDSLPLAEALAADPPPAEELLLPLRNRLGEWEEQHLTLVAERDAARDTLAALARRHQLAADSVAELERNLHGELRRLIAEIGDLSITDPLRANRVAALTAASIDLPPTPIAVPDLATAAPAPAAPSPNLLLALTDFILARARREAVNSFIINLHYLASRERLLQFGFPETWGLMSSISTRSDGVLNAVEVGRIPLGVWRATLAGNFVALPLNLVARGPEGLCQASDTTVVARSQRLIADTEFQGCRRRAAELAPLVPAARRLLSGEPVLDVFLDAASFAAPDDPVLPAYWRHISQGLGILASFAQTFDDQGYARNADASLHPYYLSARSLLQVPREQQQAFVRLLLVRAVPTVDALPARVDSASFYAATTTTTRLFEQLMALSAGSDSLRRDPGQVLQSTFEILTSATDFARPLVETSLVERIDSVRFRWKLVSGAVQPLFSGDFGLALSRTVILLRDVRGVNVPAPVMTFAALGSALSEAQTGQQIEAAFEAAASPVGGWQAKRYGEGMASVTAFPGTAAGREYLIRRDDDPEAFSSRAGTLGASLPIGLELQFKLRSDSPAAQPGCVVCGAGLFLPLIDVGALLSYRVSGPDTVEPEPNASFRQVFAPGAYLSLPLTRTVPVTLLIGGQLMPSLRTVEAAEGDDRRSAIRYGISLGMDIMLLDF